MAERRRRSKAGALALALTVGIACGSETREVRRAPIAGAAPPRYEVRYDQCGYLPDAESFAVVGSQGMPAPGYRLYDSATQRIVTQGKRRAARGRHAESGRDAADVRPYRAGDARDRPLLARPGRRLARGAHRSRPRRLCPCPPSDHAVSRLAALWSDVEVGLIARRLPPLPGRCGRAFRGRRGRRRRSPSAVRRVELRGRRGGWHDAGDYLKFVGTTAYVLAVELMALRDHRAALGSGGDDLAVELRWGLDWLLKMVAGAEPYHQVGGEGDHDPGWRLPESDTTTPLAAYDGRPLFRMARGHGRNLLGRSAAAFAFGAQVYASDPAYARRLLAAARSAQAQAKARPGVQNPDPPDFYRERSGDDDLVLGAAALARATSDAAFAADALALGRSLAPKAGTPIGWDSVDALALLEAARVFPAGSPERSELAQRLTALAAPIAVTATAPVGPGGVRLRSSFVRQWVSRGVLGGGCHLPRREASRRGGGVLGRGSPPAALVARRESLRPQLRRWSWRGVPTQHSSLVRPGGPRGDPWRDRRRTDCARSPDPRRAASAREGRRLRGMVHGRFTSTRTTPATTCATSPPSISRPRSYSLSPSSRTAPEASRFYRCPPRAPMQEQTARSRRGHRSVHIGKIV